MKHKLSASILIPTLAIKCMHSVCVSSQLLVSVLFIAVPTNTENFNFSLYLFTYFSSYAIVYSYVHNTVFILHRQDNSMAMVCWLGYINCNSITRCISLLSNSQAITLKCIDIVVILKLQVMYRAVSSAL